jgi:hypothetical protein
MGTLNYVDLEQKNVLYVQIFRQVNILPFKVYSKTTGTVHEAVKCG